MRWSEGWSEGWNEGWSEGWSEGWLCGVPSTDSGAETCWEEGARCAVRIGYKVCGSVHVHVPKVVR